MAITAAMVKELRERTGAGMMECKNMLVESNGDMDEAISTMRKKGAAKADRKAGRIAAEGRIVASLNESASEGVLLEVNSETDFVAKDGNFVGFVEAVGAAVLVDKPVDVAALINLPLENGETVEETRAALVSKVGENIQVRRFELMTTEKGSVYSYLHGEKIGVILSMVGGDEALGKDIAMHIAASNPSCVTEDEVPAEDIAKEKEILIAQAEGSGKPANIIEKMVEGRMRKFLSEITLVGQPFVKDPDQTVGKLLKSAGASIEGFVRYEVGDGIEKKQEDFAAEVKAQMGG